MIERVRFLKKFRCFDAGDEVALRPGVNLLVGDQGSGKSSLLHALRTHNEPLTRALGSAIIEVVTDGPTEVYSFDFEKDNPRIQQEPAPDGSKLMLRVAVRRQSHGQFVNALLGKLPGGRGATILLDEPDMALSVRSVRRLGESFAAVASCGRQIVAAAHNPILIQRFEMVLSLEHRRWMLAEEFMASHMQ